jgi:hypothetical protein
MFVGACPGLYKFAMLRRAPAPPGRCCDVDQENLQCARRSQSVLDQARITRDGNGAIIDYADPEISDFDLTFCEDVRLPAADGGCNMRLRSGSSLNGYEELMPCPRRTAVRWPCSFSQEHGPDPAPVNHPQGRGHPVRAPLDENAASEGATSGAGLCGAAASNRIVRARWASAAGRPPLRGGYRNQFGTEPTRPNKS